MRLTRLQRFSYAIISLQLARFAADNGDDERAESFREAADDHLSKAYGPRSSSAPPEKLPLGEGRGNDSPTQREERKCSGF